MDSAKNGSEKGVEAARLHAQVVDALPAQVVVVATARLPAQVADALPAQVAAEARRESW